MNIKPPKKKVFWLSVILGIAGIVCYMVAVFAGVSWMLNIAFWVALGGLALLALGNTVKCLWGASEANPQNPGSILDS